jgi:hypothetical protein
LKVKITYTVDMDKVLDEVTTLYARAFSMMGGIQEEHKSDVFIEENLTESLINLDEIRKKMYHVDLLLNDVDGIIRSYMETKFNLNRKEETKELLNG